MPTRYLNLSPLAIVLVSAFAHCAERALPLDRIRGSEIADCVWNEVPSDIKVQMESGAPSFHDVEGPIADGHLDHKFARACRFMLTPETQRVLAASLIANAMERGSAKKLLRIFLSVPINSISSGQEYLTPIDWILQRR